MELDWSEQSPHIRTLYRPWHPGDGYEENVIAAAEARLGVLLPAPLRIFYQAWGQRKDMTRTNQILLRPTELALQPGALVFCLENQAVCSWAIPHDYLADANPPVVRTEEFQEWYRSKGFQELYWSAEVDTPIHWMPSHHHLSDFLDTLTYQHAFCGGALHGGWGYFQPQKFHEAWLERYFHRIMVRPMAIGLVDENNPDIPLYKRNGLVLYHFENWCQVTARSVEDLDTIAKTLQITWEGRW